MTRIEDGKWAVATIIATAFCIACVPLLPMAWLGARMSKGEER